MALKKYSDGEVLYAAELNALAVESLSPAGLNLIRLLIEHNGIFSLGEIDWWGDAYIDANGRENSVDTGATTAVFATNQYTPSEDKGGAWTDGTSTTTPHGWTVVTIGSGAFDVYSDTLRADAPSGDINQNRCSASTENDIFAVSNYVETDIETWNSSGAGIPNAVAYLSDYQVGGSGNISQLQQTRNGSSNLTYTWKFEKDGTEIKVLRNDVAQSAIDISGWGSEIYIYIYSNNDSNGSAQSYTRVDYITNTDSSWATLYTGEAEVVQTIPSGSFNDTISEAIGIPLMTTFETGADVTFKLTNAGGDDSGYLDAASPAVSTFTAFTAEPDTLTIKLSPKSTTPTTLIPSIKGFAIRLT